MTLAAALSAAGSAAGSATQALGGLSGALQSAGSEAEITETFISRLLKSFGNTKSIIAFESSLVNMQRATLQSVAEIRALDKGLSQIAKGSTYSRAALVKLTAEFRSNMAAATMSNDAFLKLTDSITKQFPQGAQRALGIITQLSDQFVSMTKAMQTGDSDIIQMTADLNALTAAADGNWSAFNQITTSLTPVSNNLRDLSIAQAEVGAKLDDSRLAWAEQNKSLSEAAIGIDGFIADNYKLVKTLGMVGAAVGTAVGGFKLFKVAKSKLGGLFGAKRGQGAGAQGTGGAMENIASALTGGAGGAGGAQKVFVVNWPAGGMGGGGPMAGDMGLGEFGPGNRQGRAAMRRARGTSRFSRIGRALGRGGRGRGGMLRGLMGMLGGGGGAGAARGAGGLLGRAGGLMKLVGTRALGPLGAITGAMDLIGGFGEGSKGGGGVGGGIKGALSKLFTGEATKKTGYGSAMLSGGLKGAGIGMMFGPVGAAIGGAIGAGGGALMNWLKGGKGGKARDDDKKKAEEIKKKEQEIREATAKRLQETRKVLRERGMEINIATRQLDVEHKLIEARREMGQANLDYLEGMDSGFENIKSQLETNLSIDKELLVNRRKRLTENKKLIGLGKERVKQMKEELKFRIEQEKDPEKKKALQTKLGDVEKLAGLPQEELKAKFAKEEVALRKAALQIRLKQVTILETVAQKQQEELGLQQQIFESQKEMYQALKTDPITIRNAELASMAMMEKKLEVQRKLHQQIIVERDKQLAQAKTEEQRNTINIAFRKKLLSSTAKQAQMTADLAKKADTVRRSWMEMFQAQMMGADTGTHLMPGASQLSGLQERGAAFRPFGPTRAGGGAGTYADIYQPFERFREAGRTFGEQQTGQMMQGKQLNIEFGKLEQSLVNMVGRARKTMDAAIDQHFEGK